MTMQEMNDDPKHYMNQSNDYPYLVAIGEKKNEIKCFYITVENQLILVRILLHFNGANFQLLIFFVRYHLSSLSLRCLTCFSNCTTS